MVGDYLTQPEITACLEWVSPYLHEKRLNHIIGVCEKAVELGEGFGFSRTEIHDVAIAGLIHDVLKLQPIDTLIQQAKILGITLSADDVASPQILHALVGAKWIQKEKYPDNTTIFDAVFYHTTGQANLSDTTVLVYVADKIERRTRDKNFCDSIDACFNFADRYSLYHAYLAIMDDTIDYLESKKQIIHPWTLASRQWMLHKLSQTYQK